MAVSEWYQAKEGQAEHLVYLSDKAKELSKLINKEKTMIIRGAAGKKVPLGGRVKINDLLYFVETGGNMMVTHRAVVKDVIESEKMTPEESQAFIEKYGQALNLSKDQLKRWSGKKFLAVLEIHQLEEIEPFQYRRDKNMDDWIITEDINSIRL